MNEIEKKIGDLLKSERVRRELSLEDLSEKLKITLANLESIEAGDKKSFPSELYFKLFSKSYSEYFGIDYERTHEAIKDELGLTPLIEEKHRKTKTSKATESEDDISETKNSSEFNPTYKKLIYIFGGIILSFAIFITINKIFFTSNEKIEQSQTNDSAEATEITNQVDPGELAAFDWTKADYQNPEKIKLRLLPQDQSWATVVADGDTVIYRTLNSGRIYDVEADYRILISVGIPSVVRTELNGTVVNLVNPESRRISRVEINQMNLASIINPETDQPEKIKKIEPAKAEQSSKVQDKEIDKDS